MSSACVRSDEPEVLCRVIGCAGIMTLNRPKVLNALNLQMIRTIRIALDTWEDDHHVKCVIVEGAGDKAFCAGGDVRAMRQKAITGHYDEALTFWREEYQLNSRIFHYTKPYIALLDGIVMGGGAGLSLHGRYRVGTHKLVFAMPETGIGLFPDVGVGYVLARLPHATGEWLALTGERLNLAQSHQLGIITHGVQSTSLHEIRERICGGENIDTLLSTFACDHDDTIHETNENIIRTCFDAPDLLTVLSKLTQQAPHDAFAKQMLDHLKTRCPLSLLITHEHIKRSRQLSFDEVLMMDYRLIAHMVQEPDFHEGVRAVVVDKDQKPRWHYQLGELDHQHIIKRMFGGFEPMATRLLEAKGTA